MSIVTAIVECSDCFSLHRWAKRSCTTFGWTPFANSCVAWEWRRSWKRTRGKSRPIRPTRYVNSCVRLAGCLGSPSTLAQTSVSPDCLTPRANNVSAWACLCLRNSAMAKPGRATPRPLRWRCPRFKHAFDLPQGGATPKIRRAPTTHHPCANFVKKIRLL